MDRQGCSLPPGDTKPGRIAQATRPVLLDGSPNTGLKKISFLNSPSSLQAHRQVTLLGEKNVKKSTARLHAQESPHDPLTRQALSARWMLRGYPGERAHHSPPRHSLCQRAQFHRKSQITPEASQADRSARRREQAYTDHCESRTRHWCPSRRCPRRSGLP